MNKTDQKTCPPVPFKGTLIAWNTPANLRILVAYIPGTDPTNLLNLVRVRVVNNENFIRGMELQAAHAQGDLDDLVGNCPRWRGKY